VSGEGVKPVLLKFVEIAEAANARLTAADAAAIVLAVLLSITRTLAALAAHILSGLRAFGDVAGPLARMFVGEFHATLTRVVAYGCALGAMGLFVSEVMTLPRGLAVAQATDTEWAEINRPFAAFALSMPEFDEAARYAGFRHANGGGRKDVLTFGGAGGATAVVELYRPGGESDPDANDITASISQLRLSSVRPALPDTIDTKFGPVAIEAFADRAPSGERGCVKFSRAFEEPNFELSGWFCNSGPEMVDHGMIACALDRLTLLAAGSDPRLGALFARAELKRTFCGTNSVFVAATPKRRDWIEASRDPRLRGGN
jgi:hypothetical protein